jgi:S1-C subfamily serine protease
MELSAPSRRLGGPAAKAGIGVGDAIVSVDGRQISTTSVLSAVLAELKPGQTVPVVVKSQRGTKTTLRVTLGTYPGS